MSDKNKTMCSLRKTDRQQQTQEQINRNLEKQTDIHTYKQTGYWN